MNARAQLYCSCAAPDACQAEPGWLRLRKSLTSIRLLPAGSTLPGCRWEAPRTSLSLLMHRPSWQARSQASAGHPLPPLLPASAPTASKSSLQFTFGSTAGAWLVQFPRSGHGFLWQNMDTAVAVVDDFLEEAAPLAGGVGASSSCGSDTEEARSEL